MKCSTCGKKSSIDLTDAERCIDVHVCAECMKEIRRDFLMHDTLTLNAAAIFNIRPEQVTEVERKRAKDAVVAYFKEGAILL